jgi:hypothetical protein
MEELPAAGPQGPVPFVTVSFSADIPLLRLQARSFARLLLREPGRRILVINNDDEPDRFADAFSAQVLPEYGPHAAAVTLLPRQACLEGHDETRGWRRQQMLKWAFSRLLPDGFYLTLDSKNFLVHPWREADLRGAGGAVRLPRRRLSERLEPSFRYFVPEGPPPDRVSNITTPYALSAPHVRAMLEAIVAREGGSPFDLLAPEASFFEYALYWSFITARGATGLYDLGLPPIGAGLWSAELEEVRMALAVVEEPRTAWFALHRRTSRAEPEVHRLIAARLVGAGLFAEEAEALALFAELRLGNRG